MLVCSSRGQMREGFNSAVIGESQMGDMVRVGRGGSTGMGMARKGNGR